MTFRELMVVIAIACQKSGAGKSTTATDLLVCALRESLRALIIDVDPQGSACDWGHIRATSAAVGAGPAVIACEPAQLTATLRAKAEAGCQLAILDTAGTLGPEVDAAMRLRRISS